MKAPSGRQGTRSSATAGGDLRLRIESFGPSAEEMRALAQSVMKQRSLKTRLARTKNRLLSIDVNELPADTKPAQPKRPDRFRAIVYDYTNNVALHATGSLVDPSAL